jgi:cytochrome c biogenesis protein CcdA
MLGLDEAIGGLGGSEASLAVALLVAVLLGLRHATDPDHLTAISTLTLSEGRRGARAAGSLGLCWGLGHAVTLTLLGLPVVLAGDFLPAGVQRAAEVAIGAVIVVLAARLLLRWRRGYFHAHEHSHAGSRHAHPHFHEHSGQAGHPGSHEHAHEERLGRSPLAAFGIGLIHGVGGSAGAGILLVSAIPGREEAVAALLLFAAGTAVSMALVSAAFGAVLARRPLRRLEAAVPAFGVVSLLFGVWYALGALETVPYAF